MKKRIKAKEKIDKNNPPLTKKELASMRPMRAVLPELAEWSAKRGRGKQKAPVKVPVMVRVDKATCDIIRNSGKRWQTRLNKVLGEVVKNRRYQSLRNMLLEEDNHARK